MTIITKTTTGNISVNFVNRYDVGQQNYEYDKVNPIYIIKKNEDLANIYDYKEG